MKMADIAEQAEFVWCLNLSETLFFLTKNDSNDDGKNFVGFQDGGIAVCDRKIALLILQTGEI